MVCDAGKYKIISGSFTCQSCPADSTSPEKSASVLACVCVAGTTGPNGGSSCLACDTGKYKSTPGSKACASCPTDAISGPKSTECQCIAGTTGKVTACTACSAGTYKNTTGSSQCTSCPDGSTSAEMSVSVTACRCVPGTAGINGGHCVKCPIGTYKNESGPANCTVCPRNTITSTVGSSKEGDCLCDKGFSNDNGRGCVACEPGKYKDETGPTKCLGCPTNSFANASSTRLEDCKCNHGFVSNGIQGISAQIQLH